MFRRVPRANLEVALTSVPSVGFIKECHSECSCTNDTEFDYGWGTSWVKRFKDWVDRQSVKLLCSQKEQKELSEPEFKSWNLGKSQL